MSDVKFSKPEGELPISKWSIAGDFLYTWGDGVVIRPGHEKEDMRTLFDRLKALLAEHGLGFSDVAKVTALLTRSKDHWPIYTEVYREYFKAPFPCRTTIPIVTDDSILEIDLVAYKKGLSAK